MAVSDYYVTGVGGGLGREEGEGVGVDVGEQQSETPLVLPAPCGNVPCCKTKDVWQQSGPFVLQSHDWLLLSGGQP